MRRRVPKETVHLLIGCLILSHSPSFSDDRGHNTLNPGGSKPPQRLDHPDEIKLSPENTRAPEADEPGPGFGDKCNVRPQALENFAMGSGDYDFGQMVTYLSASGCQGAMRQAGRSVSRGIPFTSAGPLRLDTFAVPLQRGDLDGVRRTEKQLAEKIPALLRDNPMTGSEMLNWLGQLALLSQPAARIVLANMIQQELVSGNRQLASSDGKAQAEDLASTLVRMGAAESLIASELAESISEMAVLSQGRALSELFPALGAAASVDKRLVPTFNLTAAALNGGVQRANGIYSDEERRRMAQAVIVAIKAALKGGDVLEPAATELNDAFSAILGAGTLRASDFKRIWNEVTALLARSSSQTALAEAMALALTPRFVFLSEPDRKTFFAAAANYPVLAGSIQRNFLLAWQTFWNRLGDGGLSPQSFNGIKEKYFEPIVANVLELDTPMIDTDWLQQVLDKGLLTDEAVEKKFPRFVLAYLDRLDRAGRRLQANTGVDPTLNGMTENLAVLWTLSRIHVPALMTWVKKYEGQEAK